MPRVYPQRVLDLIEDELYEEFADMDEETAVNGIEDEQRQEEDASAEKAEIAHQRSLSAPTGIAFIEPVHLDNLPPLHNGSACAAASRDGLDNLPPLPPLFGGRRWPNL